MQEEQAFLPPGSIVRDPIGKCYVTEEVLGTGGFGAVYLVHEQGFQQRFALKEEINPDRHRRASFAFEGELLRQLYHRTLPRVYRVFESEHNQRIYILMEYIEGQNLYVLLRDQPGKRFPLPLALALMEPVVDALIYLHRQHPPIVHRDVKPANIIIQPKSARAALVDFGSAKEYLKDGTTAVIRHVTHGYAAPEQYGGGTTPRSDIYSLGATFYTVLTGQTPQDALLRATISKGSPLFELADLLSLAIPQGIARAIERAMAIQSDDRFETVEQFWQEVRWHTSQESIDFSRLSPRTPPEDTRPGDFPRLSPRTPPPENTREELKRVTSPKERSAPRFRRQRAMLLLALIMLLAIATGAGFLASTLRNLSTAAASQQGTPSLTSATSAIGGAAPDSPVATLTPLPTMYPRLNSLYAGTIFDLLAHEKTALYLTNIQQNQGTIHGTFQGLGLIGPFQGTVTPSGQLHFMVSLYAGQQTLVCDGTIKTGGDITGTFQVLDLNGNPTGESGPWYVAATP